MNEKELKEIGEKLAGEAARADVGSKQLRELYRLSKTRPMPLLEAYIKRQIARASKGGGGGPTGFDRFGPSMLEVLKEFEDDKGGLQKVLEYANMLYDYVKMNIGAGREERRMERTSSRPSGWPPQTEGDEAWQAKLEPIVREYCSEHGFGRISLEDDRGTMLCRVWLRRFRGDPAPLASDLYRGVLSHYPELSGSIRFWIERA